jgi:tetratricopeptide (TPR) repeat protein
MPDSYGHPGGAAQVKCELSGGHGGRRRTRRESWLVAEAAPQLLRQVCDDLRLLRTQAGGPSLRALGVQLRRGKSQLAAVLNGQIRQLPDWELIKGLVDSCHRYADEHGRLDRLSMATGIEQYWRPRYTLLEYAFGQRSATPAAAAGPDGGGAHRPGRGPVVPRQLPGAVRHFTGRTHELMMLDALAEETAGAGTVMITAVGGTAGVGKTTLAVYWAHRVAGRFGDGQLYVNLRGFDPAGRAVDPVKAVRHFLDALEVPPARIPADPDAQTALYRSLLADKRMLIVLDNARDAAQVRPLLPAAPDCLVLITSRNRLSSLVAAEGAHPLMLDLFTSAEARDALADRLGADRVAAEPEAVDEIIERCARLPLALAVVTARAAMHPELPLAAVALELADAPGRLGVFADHDPHTDVRAVFSWSYQALTPPAARLFRLLSLHPGPDVTIPATASLAAVPLPEARALLTELTSANLTAERRPGRYTWHDLLRDYAAHLAQTTDSEPDRRAATGRVFDHYLHTAYAANRLLDPAADHAVPDPPTSGVAPEQFTDYRHALDWFAAERAVLLNVIDHAAAGWEARVGPLAHAVAIFLDRRGHWHDGLAIWRTAIAAADRLGDQAAEARAHCHLGRAYTRLYRFADADAHLHRALELATRTGDRTAQAHINHTLAIMCERRGDLNQALHHDRRALDLYRDTGHRLGQAKSHNAIGWHLTLLRDHEQALVYCKQALTLLQQLNDRASQAHTWDSLGHVHHHLGQHAQAVTCYQQALDLHRELGDRFSEAEALDHVGDTQHDMGDTTTARRSWQRALGILTELDHPSADHVRAKLTARDDGPAARRSPAHPTRPGR